MGVGCTVLTEIKLTNDRYPRFISGCHVIASKAASPHQGGIAVLWKPRHWDFEVEAVHVASPNILTFQLVTGGVQFFLMGAYIPPADTTRVDDLRAAWTKCPANCEPLLLGDLNTDFKAPQTKQEEIIADLLNKMNLLTGRGNLSNDEVDDREEGRDGPGSNGGGDIGISPSQITAWLGTQM
jgi:hypothetical protein